MMVADNTPSSIKSLDDDSDSTFLMQLVKYLDVSASSGAKDYSVLTLNADILELYGMVGKLVVQLAQLSYDSRYIKETINGEYSRVKGLDDASKKNIFKVREMTLMETYSREYYRFLTNIMVFSLFVTSLSLAIGAAFRTGAITSFWTLTILISIIALVYLLGMLYAFFQMRKRSRADWNQIVFKPSKTIQEAR
jgi:hypothetical protein